MLTSVGLLLGSRKAHGSPQQAHLGGDRASSRDRVQRPLGSSVMGSHSVFVPVKGCHPQSVSQCEMWDQKVSADVGGET